MVCVNTISIYDECEHEAPKVHVLVDEEMLTNRLVCALCVEEATGNPGWHVFSLDVGEES